VATADDAARAALLRRGFALEYVTLAWNVVGIIVLATAVVLARSVALAGFGEQQAHLSGLPRCS
jgi:hypothetical protein